MCNLSVTVQYTLSMLYGMHDTPSEWSSKTHLIRRKLSKFLWEQKVTEEEYS